MTPPTLLRRAAAAAIGVDRRPGRARVLRPAHNLTLARRAVAAAIGVRMYPPASATSGTSTPETGAASDGTLPSPAPLVTIDAPSTESPPRERQPRRGLVLITVAVVTAIAFGGFTAYQEDLFVEMEPPHATGAPPGALPGKYLGTWQTTVRKEPADTRTLVIRQGDVGDTVMSLTANGPQYRCVFRARLVSVGPDTVRLSKSTVVRGSPGSCTPGGPSTLVPAGKDKLRRMSGDNTLTYTRAD